MVSIGRSMVDDHVLAVLAALAAMASILRWILGGSKISDEVTAAWVAAWEAAWLKPSSCWWKGDRGEGSCWLVAWCCRCRCRCKADSCVSCASASC